MVEIGKFRTIAPNIKMDALLSENAILKQKQTKTLQIIAVSLIVVGVVGYWLYRKAKLKENENRTTCPECEETI
jgi:hypothetical protein